MIIYYIVCMTNKIIGVVLYGSLSLLIVTLAGARFFECPYKACTGESCFFCGTLTSFIFALYGQFKYAWQINPAGIFLLAVVVFLLLAYLLRGVLYDGNSRC
jgi:ABC-type Na+ efflux pump permease subunit